jgi:hypothetical protein
MKVEGLLKIRDTLFLPLPKRWGWAIQITYQRVPQVTYG